MSLPRIAVFAYNFPHKKTQDFLTRLFLEDLVPRLVLAADPVPLDIPKSSIRTKVRHQGLVHPRDVAKRIGAEYQVVHHNSDEAIERLHRADIELAVVSGARILKTPVIRAVPKGIINFHPGLIPEVRGLDALLWAVVKGIPLGVTAHLIDERVDAGTVLVRQEIVVQRDDTAFDLSERLMETQLDMLRPAIELALSGQGTPIELAGSYNRKMSPELEHEALRKLPRYLEDLETRHRGTDTEDS